MNGLVGVFLFDLFDQPDGTDLEIGQGPVIKFYGGGIIVITQRYIIDIPGIGGKQDRI